MRWKQIQQHEMAFARHRPLAFVHEILGESRNTITLSQRSKSIQAMPKVDEELLGFTRIEHLCLGRHCIHSLLFGYSFKQLKAKFIYLNPLTARLSTMTQRQP